MNGMGCKTGNYTISMVGVSGIPLDYVTNNDIPVGSTAANEYDRLEYQAIQIIPDWGANIMSVYTELNACCLDDE